jgi:23S rRNA pseudoU1915 N3-methylase RlmH
MVMGSKYGHCPIWVSNQGPLHHWPNALTYCANRANKNNTHKQTNKQTNKHTAKYVSEEMKLCDCECKKLWSEGVAENIKHVDRTKTQVIFVRPIA